MHTQRGSTSNPLSTEVLDKGRYDLCTNPMGLECGRLYVRSMCLSDCHYGIIMVVILWYYSLWQSTAPELRSSHIERLHVH